MAALQLKLTQLTSNQQPGQADQSTVYQLTDEQIQQTYVTPSQDSTEASQIQHVIIFSN